MNQWERIVRQNGEIDRLLEIPGMQGSLWSRVLDAYFRKGLNMEHDGWIRAARLCDLRLHADGWHVLLNGALECLWAKAKRDYREIDKA